jgi:hypothetical protein
MKSIISLFLMNVFISVSAIAGPTGGAIISADKMNILYIGLSNPISATAPGYTDDQTIVTFSGGGEYTKLGSGHYMFKPDGSQREVTVKVSVKMADSTLKLAGQQVYRIRKIPHPEVLFGTKNGGSISKGEIAAVSQINCGLGEGFAFEGLKFSVNSYTLIIVHADGSSYTEEVSGNRITARSKEEFENIKSGAYIIITSVDATGPAGKVVISGVSLKVK